VHFVDHEAALLVFDCIFANDPRLRSNITADALPVSFRITAAPGSDLAALRRQIRALPAVDAVGAAGS
jgi:cell division protein FtsX